MGLITMLLLPTKLFRLSNAGRLVLNDKIDRFVTLSCIHYEEERIMGPLEEAEFNASSLQIPDGTNAQMNFAIGNFCGYLP